MSRVNFPILVFLVGAMIAIAAVIVENDPDFFHRTPDGWRTGFAWAFLARARGLVYFRVFGWGLWAGTYAGHEPLFSERNGFMRVLFRTKAWRVRLLAPAPYERRRAKKRGFS